MVGCGASNNYRYIQCRTSRVGNQWIPLTRFSHHAAPIGWPIPWPRETSKTLKSGT